MAAEGPDELRFSTDFPELEDCLQAIYEGQVLEGHGRFGTLQKMLVATTLFLLVAENKGQDERVGQLLIFQERLQRLPEQCSDLLGKEVSAGDIQIQLDPDQVLSLLSSLFSPLSSLFSLLSPLLSLSFLIPSQVLEEDEDEEEGELFECPICFGDYEAPEMRLVLEKEDKGEEGEKKGRRRKKERRRRKKRRKRRRIPRREKNI
jgi:hypothetical protein